MSLEILVNLSRLFIPVIAFAGIYIAWQQFTANREKIRFELYEKRFKIYSTIIHFMDTLLWAGSDSLTEEYIEFNLACHEAEFILPESINVELRKLKNHVRSWKNINRRLAHLNKSEENDEKIDFAKKEIMEIESIIEEMGDNITSIFMLVLKVERF